MFIATDLKLLDRPGSVEAGWFKSGRYGGLTGEMPLVVCLSLGRRDVAYWLKQAIVVKLGHPFERRERVVITVSLAANRRLEAGFGEPLAVPNGHVLRPAIRVMNKAVALLGLTRYRACSSASRTKSRNCRLTLSSGHAALLSLIVVRTTLSRITPRNPSRRISRSTVHRAAAMPSRAS